MAYTPLLIFTVAQPTQGRDEVVVVFDTPQRIVEPVAHLGYLFCEFGVLVALGQLGAGFRRLQCGLLLDERVVLLEQGVVLRAFEQIGDGVVELLAPNRFREVGVEAHLQDIEVGFDRRHHRHSATEVPLANLGEHLVTRQARHHPVQQDDVDTLVQ